MILEGPALIVLGAISAAGTDRAVLVGHGWGSMVALQVAATHHERVAALMLSTNARLETIALRSLYHGVLSLLPATVVQQLGARPPQVLDLFDQARPADFRSLAGRIPVPALVIVGEQDAANRGPSACSPDRYRWVICVSCPVLDPAGRPSSPSSLRSYSSTSCPTRNSPSIPGRQLFTFCDSGNLMQDDESVARRGFDHGIVAVSTVIKRPERGVVMADVLLDMAISLDGFVAGPGGADAGLYDWYFNPSEISQPVIAELVARPAPS